MEETPPTSGGHPEPFVCLITVCSVIMEGLYYASRVNIVLYGDTICSAVQQCNDEKRLVCSIWTF